jgi:sulfite exporter TauE/SafE
MLSSIHPFGERSRNNRYGLTVTSYVIGSMLGGLSAGATFGLLGVGWHGLLAPSPGVTLIIGFVLAAGGLAFDLRIGGLTLPSLHRQVNEDWLTTYRNWVYGGGWGFQLGFGLMTIVPSASVYVLFALVALQGSLLWGMAIGLIFGLARSLTILSMVRVDSPERLRAAHRTLQHWAAAGHRTAVGGLAVAGAILGGGALWR